MVAMLGMAVGTGNIWRFPRIAASNGGGEFLVAWVVFLLLWSVPLILVEFALGKRYRRSCVGTFAEVLGPRFAWMGAWIALIAAAIGFYYAVVMGWTLRYLFAAVTGTLAGNSEQLWQEFSFTPASVGFQFLAVGLAVLVVAGGVRGIERATSILMPGLIVLVIVLAIRAVTLPGAELGLNFLFTPDWGELLNYKIWLEALTQNAWDTGAGWGLVTAYAVYSRSREDTNLNGFLLAFGNNSISLLAGIMVFCTVFSVQPNAETLLTSQSNEGLTFIWIPRLLEQIPGGAGFMVLFFLALVFAAWTSMVAMIELMLRALEEVGVGRRKALMFLAPMVFLLGVPSALHQAIFSNQDAVWSIALMLSGFFFSVLVFKIGPHRFRQEYLNVADQDMKIGVWWEWVIRLVPVQALILFAWFLWQARGEMSTFFDMVGPSGWPGIGNMLLQWGVVALVFFFANGFIVRGLERYGQKAGD